MKTPECSARHLSMTRHAPSFALARILVGLLLLPRPRLGLAPALAILIALPANAGTTNGIAGDWQGTYVCAQGPTELTLRIRADAGNRVTAFFHFYAGIENPLVPEGCFGMAGVYRPETRHIDLQAGRWILQPGGFVTVDLSGTVSRDGSHMAGTVIGPGCTQFSVLHVMPMSARTTAACRSGEVVALAGAGS